MSLANDTPRAAGKQRLNEPFMWLVIAAGAAVCLFAACNLPLQRLGLPFLLLAVVTVALGSRIGIQIPHVRAEITVSDTFIFLTVLLYDGEAAILVAAADALFSSLRFSRKWLTRLFNASLLACSTFLTVWTLRLCFGSIRELTTGDYSAPYVIAICIMASVQYVSNSGLAALRESFKLGQPFWPTWKTYYLWTSITYFAGASAAAVNAKLISVIGLYALVVTFPIIAIVYFTYRTYRQNLESAERHAEEQRRISEALRQSEEHYRNAFEHFHSAFDHASIGMALVAPGGRWLQVNNSLCEIVGYTEPELLERNVQAVTHPDDLGHSLADMYLLTEGKAVSTSREQRYIHKSGHELWVMVSTSVVRDSEGRPLHLIKQVQDISERRRAEHQLHHAAFHDSLTKLPNRVSFTEHLRLAIERAKRADQHLYAVLFLDCDRFKIINDSLGHALGDRFLVAIAERLEKCMRPEDTVARFGGDEFAVLLNDLQHFTDATRVAERIQKELRRQFILGGHEVFTSVSIGIALSTPEYEQPDDILRDADTAMYRAKASGKGRYEIFDKVMHARATALLQMESDLRRAVEREEFLLHYQPIIRLDDGSLSGFEALVRWRHPERGLIPPAEFIPVAEETEMILHIGEWVLREACHQMRRWQDEFPATSTSSISVNLSARQFKQPGLVNRVESILDEMGLAPGSLRLEITESMIMEDAEASASMLRQLRALGVQLSIDDFGTGYSSLSYLHRFPATILKVDRSFVGRMVENEENMEIVRTILTLARGLRMRVVAEGVETSEQVDRLRELGCEYGQGYLFSKPVDAETASALMAHAPRWRSRTPSIREAHSPDVIKLLDGTYSM